jgi:hypothetical protein
MAHLHKVGSRLIVSGLAWTHPGTALQTILQAQKVAGKPQKKAQLPSDTSRGYAAAVEKLLIKGFGAAFIAGTASDSVIGFLTKREAKSLGQVPPFSKIYSLAEVFCGVPNLPRCAILAVPVEIPADHYAMCVVIDGRPAPDTTYDTVVPQSAVSDLIETWKFALSQVLGVEPTVYGQMPGARDMSMPKLLADSFGYSPMRRTATDMSVLAPIIAVLVVAIGAGAGWQYYKKEKARKAAIARQQKLDPIRLYAQALDAQWPALRWGSATRVRSILSQVSRLPLDVGGFSLSDSVTCDVPTGACQLTYKRKDGTYVLFKNASKGLFENVTYGQAGDTVQAAITIKNAAEASPPPLTGLPPESSISYAFWPEVQQYSPGQVSGTLSPTFVLYPTMSGISETSLPKVIRSTEVSMTVPFWAFQEMPPESAIFSSAVSWTTITIPFSAKGTSTITMKGNLYATKGDL